MNTSASLYSFAVFFFYSSFVMKTMMASMRTRTVARMMTKRTTRTRTMMTMMRRRIRTPPLQY